MKVGSRVASDALNLDRAGNLTPGDWILVRPDGYIGAIVAAQDIAFLERYLENVGLTVAESCYG